MNTVVFYASALAAVYLVAAIPFSLLVGRFFFGIDLRSEGSRNLGATNTFRVLGMWAGALVAVLDMAKGVVVLAVAKAIAESLYLGFAEPQAMLLLVLAVLGHTFSPYVKFRGGKGVAVAAGIILWEAPLVFVIMFVIFASIIAFTRYVSLASVVCATLLPLLMYLCYSRDTWVLILSLVIGGYIVWKHRSNLHRLFRGEENKVTFKRRR